MTEATDGRQKERAAKIRRRLERESVLQPTFAAARSGMTGRSAVVPPWEEPTLLQRQCACGMHTIGGGVCSSCRREHETGFLQRTFDMPKPHHWPDRAASPTRRDLTAAPSPSFISEGPKTYQPGPNHYNSNAVDLNVQRDSEDAIVHESEFFVHGQFIQIDYDNTQVTPDQIRQLLHTLELIPPPHISHVPTITVGNRPPRGGGGSAHSGMPGGPYIRINRTCFSSSWNRGAFNETLLHELGHIVDWAYDCMRHMRRENPTGYRALLNHPHRGRTQGPGEHFADAYADYHLGRGMSTQRREALLNSRAFQV